MSRNLRNPVNLERFDFDEPSLMTIDRDINKNFDLNELMSHGSIIIDFYRDTYSVVDLGGGRYVTFGYELEKIGCEALDLPVVRGIPFTDPSYPELWLSHFLKFSRRVNAAKANVFIAPVHQSSVWWTETEFRRDETWLPRHVIVRAKVLGFMQRIALASLRRSVMIPMQPEDIKLDETHEYGLGPSHLSQSSYDRASLLMRKFPEIVHSISASAARRSEIIRDEMSDWITMSKQGHPI